VGDMVNVSFGDDPAYGIPKLIHRVAPDGTILLPLNVNVEAVGLTAGELEMKIHEKYVPKFFTQLAVVVAPLDGMVRVIDSVGRVHKVSPRCEMSVLFAVSRALGNSTRYKTIEIIRADGTKLTMDGVKAMKN